MPSAASAAVPAVPAVPALDWAAFAKIHWERSPTVLKGVIPRELIQPAGMFEGLVRASELYRRGERPQLRVYEEDALVQCDLARYLPRGEDGDLQGFAERLRTVANGGRFGVVLNQFHRHDLAFWTSLRRFIRPLVDEVGVPAGHLDSDVFVGNYLRTPFGLHKDEASNFCLVLQGRKRMRVWPFERFVKNLPPVGTKQYEDRLAGSIVLDGEPGDILYWPSSYWHLAESEGELSACLNVAFYLDGDARELLGRALIGAAEAEDEAPSPREFFRQSAPGELPASAAAAVRRMSLSADQLEDLAASAWLARMSNLGFTDPMPPLDEVALSEDDAVQGDPDFRLVWARTRSGLVCAAVGHVLELPFHPRLPELFERLNTGARLPVRMLLDEACTTELVDGEEIEAPRDVVLGLLTQLTSMRCLVRSH